MMRGNWSSPFRGEYRRLVRERISQPSPHCRLLRLEASACKCSDSQLSVAATYFIAKRATGVGIVGRSAFHADATFCTDGSSAIGKLLSSGHTGYFVVALLLLVRRSCTSCKHGTGSMGAEAVGMSVLVGGGATVSPPARLPHQAIQGRDAMCSDICEQVLSSLTVSCLHV